MKKRVIVGSEFDDTQVEVVKSVQEQQAEVTANENKTRNRLSYCLIGVGGVFLIVSALIGLYDGSFDELKMVWMSESPLAGGLFGYYFGSQRSNSGNKKG